MRGVYAWLLLPSLALVALPTHAGEPGVTLHLEVSPAIAELGDELELTVRVVNHGDKRVTLIRPVDGSWEQMREPYYGLEFVDEDGTVITTALGYGPEGRCGLVNDLTKEDRVKVGPRDERVLSGEDLVWVPPLPVRGSARPGRYKVRLTYRALELDGVTPLELVSDAVPLRIAGGDRGLWQCRRDQLAVRMDHEYVQTGPAGLLPWHGEGGGDDLLVLRRNHHRMVDGLSQMSAEILLQWVDGGAQPVGEPVLVWAGEEMGYLDLEATPGGIVMVQTPGAVGGRAVDVRFVAVNDEGIRPGKTTRISHPPGNPYIVGLARRGDHLLLAYEGGDAEGSAFLAQALDLEGHPVGSPLQLASGDEFSGFSQLLATPDGFAAVWTAGSGQGRAIYLDHRGMPTDPVIEFAFAGQFIAAAAVLGEQLAIVYSDASYDGQDLTDTMGLYRVVLDATGKPVDGPVALSPQDREMARFGVGAWVADGSFARVYHEDDVLHFGLGDAPETTRLSETSAGSAVLYNHDGRWVVLWADHRDDQSVACRDLGDCAVEAYLAILDADGAVVLPATRLSHDATPRPVAPYDDWERFCGEH